MEKSITQKLLSLYLDLFCKNSLFKVVFLILFFIPIFSPYFLLEGCYCCMWLYFSPGLSFSRDICKLMSSCHLQQNEKKEKLCIKAWINIISRRVKRYGCNLDFEMLSHTLSNGLFLWLYDCKFISNQFCLNCLVLRLKYFRQTMAVPWLHMPCLIVSPGHQEQWYWKCAITEYFCLPKEYIWIHCCIFFTNDRKKVYIFRFLQ